MNNKNNLLNALIGEEAVKKYFREQQKEATRQVECDIEVYVVNHNVVDLVKTQIAFNLTSTSNNIKVATFDYSKADTVNVRATPASTASIARLNPSRFTDRNFDVIIATVSELFAHNVMRLICNGAALRNDFKLILLLTSYEDLLTIKDNRVLKLFSDITEVNTTYNY